MANLLPPFARKELITEYWVRVTTLIFFMLSAVMFFLSLMLVPVYIGVSSNYNALVIRSDEMVGEKERIDFLVQDLQKVNVLVNQLKEPEHKRFMYYYDSIHQIADEDVSIREITIKKGGEGFEDIILRATADTRQVLISFLDRLQNSSDFGSVDVPIQSLNESVNIEFTVRIPVIK